MANQINNSAKNTVVITVLKVEYAIMVSTKYRSNPRISPTARKISQIAVACLKLSLNDLKKERIVYPSSSRTSLKVT